MQRLTFLMTCICLNCFAQQTALVRGEVQHKTSLAGNSLYVEMWSHSDHAATERAFVGNDGGFEFRSTPAGFYELRLSTADGETLASREVEVRQPVTEPLSITLPESQRASPSGTVSVAHLRHEPPKKAVRTVKTALELAKLGDHVPAASELEKAIRIDPGYPEAHVNLGTQYIYLKQPDRAINEFERAIALDPTTPVYRSNLALGLLIAHRLPEAEAAAAATLALDSTCARAHYVLGFVMATRPADRRAAITQLRLAAREVPHAHLILAELFKESGDRGASLAEFERYSTTTPGLGSRDVEKWKSALR